MRLLKTTPGIALLLSAGLVAGCGGERDAATDANFTRQQLEEEQSETSSFVYGYNAHLDNSDELRFEPLQANADAEVGRMLFGVSANLQDEDRTHALFEGASFTAGREIKSNQRTCFTCHRGEGVQFGMADLPISENVDPDDPLLTGLQADAQGDPDAAENLEEHGLIAYRPNRFNQTRSEDDPYSQVFFWRKSPALINVAFSSGFLLDGRARVAFEAARGAIFSHTQEGDDRFDDLFTSAELNDLTAFMFSLLSDPALAALRDPSDPMYETLMSDPFATVNVQTEAQHRGQQVFERDCMSCHNTPNVFNNSASLEVMGTDGTDPVNPVFGPHVGRTFNIGVSERNLHDLRFTRHVGDGEFEPIILPLANEDGSITHHTVEFDIGMAATTGRIADIGRFKVPQLRNIAELGPYFHDNSAATLEDVVDYFVSPAYNYSEDGRRFPISMTEEEKRDLLEFLYIL